MHATDILGKPDIVFRRERIAIFVDGDYWHARLLREKGVMAVRERLRGDGQEYWINKFTRRVERDDEVTAALKDAGWVVMRFWESEIKKNVAPAALAIQAAVLQRRLNH